MIHDLLVRWVVTGLFALGALGCGVPILTRRRPATVVVSRSLHFLMATGMAVMAWPWGARLPASAPAAFFLLAAVWFVAIALITARSPAARASAGYHSLMMLATAWMYLSMNSLGSLTASLSQPPAPMPEMNMAAMDHTATTQPPTWVTTMNWLGVVIFTNAAASWVVAYLRERRRSTIQPPLLGDITEAMMATGMAILFAAALIEL